MTPDDRDGEDLLNTAPCGFVAFDDRGVIVEMNETLAVMVGHSRDELLGEAFEKILSVSSRIFHQTHFFPMIRGSGKAEEIYLSLRTATGDHLPVLTNATRRESEDPVNLCAMLPIHQRRRYEDEILEAKRRSEEALRNNRALSDAKKELELHAGELDRRIAMLEQRNAELTRLSKVLSHDLRAPVRKLGSFAEILLAEDEDALTEDGRTSVRKIADEVDGIGKLLAALRQYLELSEVEEEPQVLDLTAVAREASRQAFGMVAEGVHLEIKSLPTVEGYRHQLLLLFRNLFDNSLKFRKPSEPLRVRLRGDVLKRNTFRRLPGRYRYTDFARLEFQDNGSGFDPKYREHVFDILTKLHGDAGSLGFGLAICRKVIDNHDGEITVESSIGGGTMFSIWLPLTQVPVDPPPAR